MKIIIICIVFMSLSLSAFAQEDEMKLEGTCTGNYDSGKKVKFTYFSNFDGCREKIMAALKFSPNSGARHYKGKRAFKKNQDIYTVGAYRVTFKNSTGNREGIFSYLDAGIRKSIEVKCEIRDYEYYECPM